MRALEAELGGRTDHSEIGFLRDLVVRDLTSLQDLLASIDGAQISRAVDLMEEAETIYLLGQLRSAPVVNIVEEVAARDVPIAAISDSTSSPLAKNAQVVFAVPEHEYTFSRSLAAPICLAQALTVALAARLQKTAGAPRIPIVTGA